MLEASTDAVAQPHVQAGLPVPFVTVIIPVRDDHDGLSRCLARLAAQDYPPDRFEVLVVDNGSHRPVELPTDVGLPAVRVLREPRPGSYAARNTGIATARGDVLAFTDADCLPEPGWLSAGVRALSEHPRVGLVVGRVTVVAPTQRPPRAVELYQMLHAFPQQRYAQNEHFGATANVLTRRSVLADVGPFAADLASGGDKEWGRRVHAAGWRIVYSDAAAVLHPPRATWVAYFGKLERVYAGELAARHRRGEGLGSVGVPTWRDLVPPVLSVARRWHDDRLASNADRVLYALGASLARWAGVVAGLRARSTAMRRHGA